MIHLFYGDAAADSFRVFGRAPKVIILREALLSGPAALPSASWNDVRSRYLAETFGGDEKECLLDLHEFDEAIESTDEGSELVCWFGRDLFCQVGLMYTLVRLGATRTKNVSLVCPLATDDEVYCFGDVAPAEMNEMLQKRAALPPLQFQHAAIAWHLYCSDDPQSLNAVFDGSIDVGARFANALEQHAARFPWTSDGLGTTERVILAALRDGPLLFSELFQIVARRTRHITWGDAQVYDLCRHLEACTPSLLKIECDAVNSQFQSATLTLTDEGRTLLQGGARALHRPHHWLGGCELSGETVWQWDAASRRIVYSGT